MLHDKLCFNGHHVHQHYEDKIHYHSGTESKAESDALLREHDFVAFDAGALIQSILPDNPPTFHSDEIALGVIEEIEAFPKPCRSSRLAESDPNAVHPPTVSLWREAGTQTRRI